MMKLIYKSRGVWVAVLAVLLYFASITATAVELDAGDEVEAVMSYDTSKSEETPNQIEGVCQIPEGFGLNAYIELKDSEGMHYYISVSQENGYADRVYVKNGTYSFVSAGVYGDNTGKYAFNLLEGEGDAVLDGGQNSFACIKVKIKNYEAIAEEIAGEQKTETPKLTLFGNTGLDGVTIDGTGELFYETSSTSSTGTLVIHGNAIDNYDVYVEIIEAGVVGEAKFKLSLDGGKTFIGDDTTADEFNLESYGIKMNFKTEVDTDELAVGDTFTAHIPATFYVSQLNPFNSNVIVAGTPKQDYQVMVDILSTEAMGKAKFSVSLDNGRTTEDIDTIPEDGVYKLGELTLYFYTVDQFSKGDQYMSTVKSSYEEPSNNGIIVIAIIVGIVLGAFVVYLLMHVEKRSDYVIQVWNERQPLEVYK